MIRQHRHRKTEIAPAAVNPAVSEGPVDHRRAEPRGDARGLAVLGPGLLLWFEVFMIQLNADSADMIGPAAAILGTLGLFLAVPALARPVWFRLALAALVLFFLCRLKLFPPYVEERGSILLPRVLTMTVAEWMLGCQALLLWRWRSRDPLPAVFFCLGLLTLAVSVNKTLPLGEQNRYVVLAAGAFVVPALLAIWSAAASRTTSRAVPWGARCVTALVCGVILLGTWSATAAWSRWLPDAQRWFADQVGRTMYQERQLHYYPTSGWLSAVRRENLDSPDMAALRVFSDRRPGYLAGRVFDHYDSGRWQVLSDVTRRGQGREPDDLRQLQPLTSVPKGLALPKSNYRVFDVGGQSDSGALRSMAIENDPHRGYAIFTPLGCRYFAGLGSPLIVDEHGIVRGGVSARVPYVAVTDTAYETSLLTDSLRNRLLSPPSGLDPRIADMARRICRSARTPQEKIRAIRNYYQDNGIYSLKSVDTPPNVDPLNRFLLTCHAAHCEFFASAAVVMLRLQGVPARYATGYRVVHLEEDDGEFWIARNRDAHAWAEAYDDGRQKWVIVEATPGFDDLSLEERLAADALTASGQESELNLSGDDASALVQWWRSLPVPVRYLLLVLSGAAVVLPGTLLFRYLRARRKVEPWARSTPGRATGCVCCA